MKCLRSKKRLNCPDYTTCVSASVALHGCLRRVTRRLRLRLPQKPDKRVLASEKALREQGPRRAEDGSAAHSGHPTVQAARTAASDSQLERASNAMF